VRHDLERRLIDDLERLRQDLPFSVDVTARVMAEVRRLGPPPRPAIASRRVVVWSSAAAILLATGVALLALLGLPAWAGDLGQAAARTAGLGGSILRFAAWVPGAAARAVAQCVDFMTAFRGLAVALAPAVAAAMAAALVAMTGITSYVVGRDLRRGRAEAR
jgi:hypothetical protein